MNNIEDTENAQIEGNDDKKLNDAQGLAKNDRHLRNRSNKVNYNILDHGDSDYQPEEDDYIEPKDGEKKSGKRGRKKIGTASEIPFIKKKSEAEKNAIGEFAIHIEEDNAVNGSDEIDKLVTGLNYGKSKRQNDSNYESIGQIIDISNLKTGKVSNSKLLLALIEICINAKNYGILQQNKSRVFWDEVYNNKDFENILKNFKAETLRKYWRTISDIGDLKSVISTIKEFENVINQDNAKLLTVIFLIQDYVRGNIQTFDLSIKTIRPKKDDSEDEYLLNRKRKNGKRLITIELANDIQEIKSRIKKSKEGDNPTAVDSTLPQNTPSTTISKLKKNIIIQSGNQKSSLLAEGDLEQFRHIEEVLESLTSKDEKLTKERALDALVFSSFNLERAFNFITKPEEFYGNSLVT
jgi:hypothetical protein